MKTKLKSGSSFEIVNSNENSILSVSEAGSVTIAGAAVATQGDMANYLPKTTYEYNKEIAFGSTGKLYIGAFPMYDSNITVEISATTSTTYNATLVIATQNINTTGGGSITATVYGDATNTIAPNIYIGYASGSNKIHVYFSPQSWSKNLIHIQAVALAGAPSDVCTSVDSIPSTATRKPTNALTANFQEKGNYLTSVPDLAASKITAMTSYSKPSSTSAISTSDSLNTAIGKLEKALDGKTTLTAVEDFIEANSEEVDLGTYFTKSDVAALFEELFEFDGTTLIIKDQ